MSKDLTHEHFLTAYSELKKSRFTVVTKHQIADSIVTQHDVDYACRESVALCAGSFLRNKSKWTETDPGKVLIKVFVLNSDNEDEDDHEDTKSDSDNEDDHEDSKS